MQDKQSCICLCISSVNSTNMVQSYHSTENSGGKNIPELSWYLVSLYPKYLKNAW